MENEKKKQVFKLIAHQAANLDKDNAPLAAFPYF